MSQVQSMKVFMRCSKELFILGFGLLPLLMRDNMVLDPMISSSVTTRAQPEVMITMEKPRVAVSYLLP